MPIFKPQLRSLISLAMLSGLTVASVPSALAQGPETKQLQTKQLEPIVLTVDHSSNGATPPVGWSPVESKQSDVNFYSYYVPNDSSLEGARIFQSQRTSPDIIDVLTFSLDYDGFDSIEILSEAPLEDTQLLDSESHGSVYIGKAMLNGESYRFASVGFFLQSAVDGPRYTSQYVFAAPDALFAQMGAFVPISSTFFQLNGSKIADLILPLGRSEPSVQATYLANATDVYFSRAAEAIYGSRISIPTFMLLEQQCTGVSGTDPDAYGVTGLENPDC